MAVRRTVDEIRDEIRACEQKIKDAQKPILNTWSMPISETRVIIDKARGDVNEARKRLSALKRTLKRRDV